MASTQLFDAALGLTAPWHVIGVTFDEEAKQLTVAVDFAAGARFPHPEAPGLHPVYDTQVKRLRHLNFFQHECYLEVRVPRIKLPSGAVRVVEPPWMGKLSGFTLLFEALVVTFCQQMPWRAVGRLVGLSWHRVAAIATRYVELALDELDLRDVTQLAMDETSSQRGHQYLTLAADAKARKVIAVAEGRDTAAVDAIADWFVAHGGRPEAVTALSIDMLQAYITQGQARFPKAEVTFDKFHVIAHASRAVDEVRRAEQRDDPALKGMRWILLKDDKRLTDDERTRLHGFLTHIDRSRTARAWADREYLRTILEGRQPTVVRELLGAWCRNVLKTKNEPMKKVAAMIRRHLEGIIASASTGLTNGFLEALNGLFQAAKRRARGYTRFGTMRTIIFLTLGRLNFRAFNPHILPT